MKKLVVFISLFLSSNYILAQTTENKILKAISIEGTQYSEIGTFSNSQKANDFKNYIINFTKDALEKKLNISNVDNKNTEVIIKNGLNRLSRLKLSKSEKDNLNSNDLVYKVKADIAFNETIGGIIIDETSSRGSVYINIYAFNKEGKIVKSYKGKSKDNIIFLGKNARRAQWMSSEDFMKTYESAFENLTEK